MSRIFTTCIFDGAEISLLAFSVAPAFIVICQSGGTQFSVQLISQESCALVARRNFMSIFLYRNSEELSQFRI